MNMLQLTSLPLYVSPFFISINIGWPSAVFKSDRGNMIDAIDNTRADEYVDRESSQLI